MRTFSAVLLLATLGALAPRAAADVTSRAQDVARLQAAARIFHEVLGGAGHSVAENVLQRGECLVIIPGDKTFALGIGGTYGKGIATCRDTGNRWGAPIFVTLGGVNFGSQIGGESADLVVVFPNRNGLEAMLNNKLRLGLQASAAAGPIGRHVEASTDATLNAQALAYARSRGLFAGVNINGAIIQPDESGNRAMYGHAYWEDVLAGRVAAPEESRDLLAALTRSPYTNPTEMARLRTQRGPAAAQPAGRAIPSPFGPPRPRAELPFAAGISYVHQHGGGSLSGFDVNLGWRPDPIGMPGLKLVLDGSRLYKSSAILGGTVKTTEWTYMAGPEFEVPRRLFTPYAHLLFGQARFTNDTVTTVTARVGAQSLAWMLGAGLRLNVGRAFYVQPIEIDELHTSFNGSGDHHLRLSIGLGVQF